MRAGLTATRCARETSRALVAFRRLLANCCARLVRRRPLAGAMPRQPLGYPAAPVSSRRRFERPSEPAHRAGAGEGLPPQSGSASDHRLPSRASQFGNASSRRFGFRISESGWRHARWIDRYALRPGNLARTRRVPAIVGELLRTARPPTAARPPRAPPRLECADASRDLRPCAARRHPRPVRLRRLGSLLGAAHLLRRRVRILPPQAGRRGDGARDLPARPAGTRQPRLGPRGGGHREGHRRPEAVLRRQLGPDHPRLEQQPRASTASPTPSSARCRAPTSSPPASTTRRSAAPSRSSPRCTARRSASPSRTAETASVAPERILELIDRDTCLLVDHSHLERDRRDLRRRDDRPRGARDQAGSLRDGGRRAVLAVRPRRRRGRSAPTPTSSPPTRTSASRGAATRTPPSASPRCRTGSTPSSRRRAGTSAASSTSRTRPGRRWSITSAGSARASPTTTDRRALVVAAMTAIKAHQVGAPLAAARRHRRRARPADDGARHPLRHGPRPRRASRCSSASTSPASRPRAASSSIAPRRSALHAPGPRPVLRRDAEAARHLELHQALGQPLQHARRDRAVPPRHRHVRVGQASPPEAAACP